MRLLRRRALPDAVRSVRLPPGERRVAWAVTAAGEGVVATDWALVLPGTGRLEWAQVERASWQPPRMTVREVAETDGAGVAHVLELAQEGDLPAAVRARVTGSVAWSAHERLPSGGGVRIVGRRVLGQELLSWQLVFDAGTDPADPAAREQAQALLEAARRSVG